MSGFMPGKEVRYPWYMWLGLNKRNKSHTHRNVIPGPSSLLLVAIPAHSRYVNRIFCIPCNGCKEPIFCTKAENIEGYCAASRLCHSAVPKGTSVTAFSIISLVASYSEGKLGTGLVLGPVTENNSF